MPRGHAALAFVASGSADLEAPRDLVTVATWYGSLGHSFLPIAVFVLGLPLLIGFSRLAAARTGRLEYGLLREPLRTGLGPHRLQLVNVLLFGGLAALTVPTGAYEAIALQLPAVYRVLVTLFISCLVAFVLLALVPLRRIRLGSNLVVAAGTIFLAIQLIMLYRPPVEPVTIGSPLALGDIEAVDLPQMLRTLHTGVLPRRYRSCQPVLVAGAGVRSGGGGRGRRTRARTVSAAGRRRGSLLAAARGDLRGTTMTSGSVDTRT